MPCKMIHIHHVQGRNLGHEGDILTKPEHKQTLQIAALNDKICCGLLNSAMHMRKTALWHCLPLHW